MFFFFKQKTAYGMRISDWSSDVCSSELVAERVDASRVAVECVQGGLETFACSAEAHVQSLGEAQERLNALELLSNRMLDRVAHSGIRTPDTPYIELALVGAEAVRAIVETALATGELQPGKLFDTRYVPLPGHEPRKDMTGLVREEDRRVGTKGV